MVDWMKPILRDVFCKQKVDDFKIKLMNYSNRLECENNFIKGIVSINTLNDLLEEIALSKYKIKNLETNATFEDNFCSILNS